jgi:hypothetical protein
VDGFVLEEHAGTSYNNRIAARRVRGRAAYSGSSGEDPTDPSARGYCGTRGQLTCGRSATFSAPRASDDY